MTGYKVSVYGDMMFILDGISLDTVYRLGVKSEDNEKLPVSDAALSDTSQNETVQTVDMEHVRAISETLPADFAFDGALEKATSENKIYTIGNRYSGDKKSKAVLTGRVTDFKTGEPMAGINIILKGAVHRLFDGQGRLLYHKHSGRTCKTGYKRACCETFQQAAYGLRRRESRYRGR